ncbi:MAG: ABC transporter ATP-binding protein [Planctomycetota bacterium]
MLRLEAVTKSFGTLRAVDGVSLDVRPGEVLGLLGPNGAGKTTTLSIAAGRLHPTSGEVRLDGVSPARASARARVGVAPQELALYDELSAYENVALFARLFGVRRRELRERSLSALDRVGLADRAKGRARTFSGGMRRRLNLAMAITHDPAIVLLDEPTAGVDPQSRHAIFDVVASLRQAGCAVVCSTHYLEEAERLCDRVVIIDHGRVLVEGQVAALIDEHGGPPRVHIESGAGVVEQETDTPMRLVAEALADPTTREVHVERPDLESVFMRLTGRRLRD